MRNNNSSVEIFKNYACSMIPFWGAYYMHSEGVKEGYVKASDTYLKKIEEWKAIVKQIKQDILGEREIFIYPQGWDEGYWMNLCVEFFSRYTEKACRITGEEKISGKKILIDFLDFCIKKFTSDKDRLQETITQLTQIKEVIEMPPSSRLKCEKGHLELTVDFLDAFGSPRDLRNYYASKNDEIPESMKMIIWEMINLRDEIKAALDTSKACNILVLGKTGTGKSSLLNYLTGEKKFDTGVGRPVTEKGIYPFPTTIDTLKVTVYDSWGIEAGDKYSEWYDLLEKEKQKHDIRKNVSEWFHAVIYCIAGARVEDVDREIINSFLSDKYYVVVALTKADSYSEEDETEMRRTILKCCSELQPEEIIGVCSVDKVVRGNHFKQFGRDELKEMVLKNFKNTIINQLPKRIIYREHELVDKFVKEIKLQIKTKKWNEEENNKWLKTEIENFQKNFKENDLPRIFREEIKEFLTVAKSLAQVIKHNDPIFDQISKIFNDDDAWYEKAGKALLIAVAIVPAVIFGIIYGLSGQFTKDERKRLSEILDKFAEIFKKELDKTEPDLKEQICKLLTPEKE